MENSTLKKMAIDTTTSDIQRTMAGCLMRSRKRNGHRDLQAASHELIRSYPMPLSDATEYAEIVSCEADDREWTG